MRYKIAFQFACTLVLGLWAISGMASSINGNQFIELSAKQKGWYFLGVLDAMKQTRDVYFASSTLEKEEFDRVWEACISGRPVRQHLAIVESWLEDNPARWHEPAITLVFEATRDSCEAARNHDP